MSQYILRSGIINVGRGDVAIENHINDNLDGAGITLKTTANPSNGGGSIFSVRSSGNALRLWVGQDMTGTQSNEIKVKLNIDGTGGIALQEVSSSDYRLKENIVDADLQFALDKLNQIRPVNYSWKNNPEDGTKLGFIAHELKPIIPEAVNGEKDAVDAKGDIIPQTLNQDRLVPVLTKCLQHALDKIAELEGRLSVLEN